jgi:hypothetical protein
VTLATGVTPLKSDEPYLFDEPFIGVSRIIG